MPASYPGSVKTYAPKTDFVDDVHANTMNEAYEEIIALETRAMANGVVKNKVDATVAPGVGDDSADGYAVNSIWVDVTHKIAYVCLDATEGAAVWEDISGLTLHKADNTLQFSQASGSHFDPAEVYPHTVKPIALFQSDETWVSGAGTQSVDAVNVKIGSQSLKILENDNTAGDLSSYRDSLTLNLSVFPDGSASSATDDYIRFAFYISDVTKVNTAAGQGVILYLLTSGGNQYYKSTIDGLVTGGNCIDIAKSAFGSQGSPNWNSITKITVFWASLVNSQNAYVSFQYIGLVRKDPSTDTANPLQECINGAWTRIFAINSGFWFLGQEFGEIVCRNIHPLGTGVASTASSLVGTKPYTDFHISAFIKSLTLHHALYITWEVDASNRIGVALSSDILYLFTTVAGTNDLNTTVAMPITINDEFEVDFQRSGTTASALVIKNGDRANPYILTKEVSFAAVGYLAVGNGLDQYANIKSLSITTTDTANYANVAGALNAPHATWIPTLTWGTATSTISASTFRYQRDNTGRVRGNAKIVCSDGKAASSLTITLPTPITNRAMIYNLGAQEKVNATWTDPFAQIDDSGTTITFKAFSAMTNGQAAELELSFDYEN